MRHIAFVTLVALSISCGSDDSAPPVQDGAASPVDSTTDECIDVDGDGFGRNCAEGADCDDRDDTVFEGCAACFAEREGCGCEEHSAPIECTLSSDQYRKGALLCKTGTRYCRDGIWTACIGVAAYGAPP